MPASSSTNASAAAPCCARRTATAACTARTAMCPARRFRKLRSGAKACEAPATEGGRCSRPQRRISLTILARTIWQLSWADLKRRLTRRSTGRPGAAAILRLQRGSGRGTDEIRRVSVTSSPPCLDSPVGLSLAGPLRRVRRGSGLRGQNTCGVRVGRYLPPAASKLPCPSASGS